MSFFATLMALLLEQAKSLSRDNPVYAGVRAWVQWLSRNLDAGEQRHGWLAWSVAVLLPTALAMGMHWLLVALVGWPLAMAWHVLVLYVTLGFRQFSHHFTRIRHALESGDEEQARQYLADWQQVNADDLPRREIVRHVIEYSVLAAHRHVFGVLACYSIGSALGLGPAGAVFFRMAEYASRFARKSPEPAALVQGAFETVAAKAWTVVDWLPSRLTALSFAVVGNFEEAIDGWRFQTQHFPNDNDGVILAATAGAIDVRLGGVALRARSVDIDAAAPLQIQGDGATTPGRDPEVAHLRSVVGLVWRSVVVWMLLLALLTLARLLG
ncbi:MULTISPECIES: CobD/CbiB family protein [unclassified Comamonas]|uniref:CobD/CbiB family protein n=1 Tax=Comamonas TaxID=283 RepID=UPI001EFB1603|nr:MULTISPECIES: CobD/CbiB family protein [unclassified Comamonas]ULR89658.1 CobD/CbiB family protein [Comamonas sp. B21-038]